MTRNEFINLLDKHFDEIKKINVTKGQDYSGDEDALLNFKRAGANLGLTPEQVLAVYLSKHYDAVMTYCKQGQVESEAIEGRIHDIILYCFLLMGLIEEKNKPNVHAQILDRLMTPMSEEEIGEMKRGARQ
jgi:hypothetical protein